MYRRTYYVGDLSYSSGVYLAQLNLFVVVISILRVICLVFVCFQAEDGIRDLVRSRGLGDVYKRQELLPRAVPAGYGISRIRSFGTASLSILLIAVPSLSLIHI